MANKPFGVEELNIVGSAGTSIIEAVADLHIQVGGGRTVGIGTSVFNIQDGTADANNDSVLNVGIVTANQYYGTFKGTIDPGTSTLSIASSLTDVIGVNANQIYPKIASEDSILFWDFSETKTTYLKIGDGVIIDGDTLKGDYTLPLTGTTGDAGVGEAIWTLTPSSGTGDSVTLKAGTNLSIDADSVGSGEFTLNVASGAGITFTGIDVKQYSDNLSPTRTERTCADPIVVDIASNTATIAIGNTSNAYGERYIQTTEPATSCDGDIWYDTSPPAGGGGSGITIEDEGVTLSTLATTLNFTGSGVVASGTGATKTITISGDGTSDGDKGDITVSSSGTVWSIDDDVVEEKHINAGGSPAADKVLVYDAAESTNWKWATQSATTSAATTKVATVKDVKTYDEYGGSAALGINIRDLNTISDPSSIGISVNTNVITIPAGTYSFKWSAPAFDVGLHNTQLQYSIDNTFATGVTKVQGTSEWTATAETVDGSYIDHCQTISIGTLASVTFTQNTYVRLVHYCQAARGDFGLGCQTQNASYGDSVYTQIEIEDLATAIKEPSGSDVPSGTIVMYKNSTAPTGWVLCDNSAAAVAAGAPDLRDKFIIGGHSWNPSVGWETNVTGSGTQSGGDKDAIIPTHDHDADASVTDPGHKHTLIGGVDDADSGNKISAGDQTNPLAATAMNDATTGISVSIDVDDEGVSGTNKNLPPYFALTFIMKL